MPSSRRLGRGMTWLFDSAPFIAGLLTSILFTLAAGKRIVRKRLSLDSKADRRNSVIFTGEIEWSTYRGRTRECFHTPLALNSMLCLCSQAGATRR